MYGKKGQTNPQAPKDRIIKIVIISYSNESILATAMAICSETLLSTS